MSSKHKPGLILEDVTEMVVMHSTAKKRNISDVDVDPEPECKTPTKRLRQPSRGASQRRKRSASPITPPKEPRKRTNERPGLIVKKKRRTKAEIAAEQAAKEARARDEAAAKAMALTGLVNIELEQEQEEAMRRKYVLRRQPSCLDVTASSSGEEFDWGSVDDAKETDEMDVDSDLDNTDSGGNSKSARGHVATANQTPVSTYYKH